MTTAPTILVIDDSELVLQMVATALRGAGYTVLTRKSPFEAFMAIRNMDLDLVLLDLTMPGLEGDALVDVVKNSGVAKGVTILFHSERDEATLSRAVEESGAAGYIRKGADMDALVIEVGRWLEEGAR